MLDIVFESVDQDYYYRIVLFRNKTKKLKLQIKSLEADLFNITKVVTDIYQKKDALKKPELVREIKNLLKAASIDVIDEVSGYEEYFVSTKGEKNIVNRPAFVDKYGNCIVKGYREVSKPEYHNE